MKKRNRALASATVLSLVLTSTMTAGNVQAAAEVTRVPGANRELTAIEVAEQVFGTAETVVLVNGYGYADAVSATPLAKALNAPILLTNKVDEPAAALKASLEKLGAKKVVIVGGEGTVTPELAEVLEADYTVERIGGKDRYATNAAVASKVLELTKATKGVLVSAEGYADALSVASVAAAKGMPVLFGNSKNVPAAVKAVAEELEVVAVGGAGVLPASVLAEVDATRVASGATRFETNLAVLDHFKADLKLENIYVAAGGATASQFADALVASAAAAKVAAPVVLTGVGAKAENIEAANDYIEKNLTEDTKITIIGGTGSVSTAIENALEKIVNPEFEGEIVVNSVEATTEKLDLSVGEDDLEVGFTINKGREVTLDDLENAGYQLEFESSVTDLIKNNKGEVDSEKFELFTEDEDDIEVGDTFEYQVVIKDASGKEVARSEAREVEVVNTFADAKEISDITIVANDVEITSNKLVLDETAQVTEVEYTNSKNVEETLEEGDFDNYDVKFTSSNPSVAFVSKTGEITAVKAGTTTITIEVKGLKKSVTITVVDAERVPTKATAETTTAKLGLGIEKGVKVTVVDQFGDPIKNGYTLLAVESDDDDVMDEPVVGAINEDGESIITLKATQETGSAKVYVRASYTEDDKSKTVLLTTINVEVSALNKVDSRKLEKVDASDDYELDLTDEDDSLELAYNTYNSKGAFLGRETSSDYDVESSDTDVAEAVMVDGVITITPGTKTGTATIKILENGILRASQKVTVVADNAEITGVKFETLKVTDVQTIDLDKDLLKPENITVKNKKGVTRIDDNGVIYLDMDNNGENDNDVKDITLGQMQIISSVFDKNDDSVDLNVDADGYIVDNSGKISVDGGAKFAAGTEGTIVVKIIDTEDRNNDGKNEVIASGTITIDIAE